MIYRTVLAYNAISGKEMLIENKSSSYPEMKPRKRELCALYNQLGASEYETIVFKLGKIGIL
jgi:hypothetical protein